MTVTNAEWQYMRMVAEQVPSTLHRTNLMALLDKAQAAANGQGGGLHEMWMAERTDKDHDHA